MNEFTLLSDEEFCSLVQRSYEAIMDGGNATVEDVAAYLDSFATRYNEDIWEKGDNVFLLIRSGQVLKGIMFYSTQKHSQHPDFPEQWAYNDQLAHQARLITSLYGAPADREFAPKRELTWRLPAGGGIVLKAERDIVVDVLTAAGLHVHDVAFKPRPEYF